MVGLIPYLLQSIAGVNEADKTHDYLASNDYLADVLASVGPSSRFYPFIVVDPDYLQASLDEVNRLYGSLDSYLKDGLGLDQETIYVLRGKMVLFNSLPGEASMTGNAAAGAGLLRELQNSSLAGTYSDYNYALQSSIDAGTLGGLEFQIGGQVHADTASYLLRQPQRIAEAEPSYAAGYALPIGESRVWLSGLASYLGTDGASGHASSNEHASGSQLGASRRLDEQLAVRGTLSYSDGEVGSAGANADANLTQLGLGARYAFERLEQGPFVDVQASAGYVDYDSRRAMGTLGSADGDSHGGLFSFGSALGYRHTSGNLWVEPRIGLQVTRLELSGFQEKGSELALNVDDINDTRTSLNSRLAIGSEAGTFEGWLLRPSMVLGYERVLGDPEVDTRSSVQGYSVKQNAAYNQRDLFSAGLDIQAQRGALTVGLAVNGLSGGDSHGLNGTLNVGLAF